jgi:hypothetical protein
MAAAAPKVLMKDVAQYPSLIDKAEDGRAASVALYKSRTTGALLYCATRAPVEIYATAVKISPIGQVSEQVWYDMTGAPFADEKSTWWGKRTSCIEAYRIQWGAECTTVREQVLQLGDQKTPDADIEWFKNWEFVTLCDRTPPAALPAALVQYQKSKTTYTTKLVECYQLQKEADGKANEKQPALVYKFEHSACAIIVEYLDADGNNVFRHVISTNPSSFRNPQPNPELDAFRKRHKFHCMAAAV